MNRLYIDCRETPGSNCTVAISANSEKELIEAVTQHAVSVHGQQDSPELRKQLAKMMKAQKTPMAA